MKANKFFLITIVTLILLSTTSYASAEPEFVEPVKIRVTCYVSEKGNARTKDGSVPKEWMCAGRKEDLGKAAILYQVKEDGTIGDMIGIFEIRDTGSHSDLKNGKRLDIYRNSMDGVREWIKTYGDYCYVQIIEADG